MLCCSPTAPPPTNSRLHLRAPPFHVSIALIVISPARRAPRTTRSGSRRQENGPRRRSRSPELVVMARPKDMIRTSMLILQGSQHKNGRFKRSHDTDISIPQSFLIAIW